MDEKERQQRIAELEEELREVKHGRAIRVTNEAYKVAFEESLRKRTSITEVASASILKNEDAESITKRLERLEERLKSTTEERGYEGRLKGAIEEGLNYSDTKNLLKKEFGITISGPEYQKAKEKYEKYKCPECKGGVFEIREGVYHCPKCDEDYEEVEEGEEEG